MATIAEVKRLVQRLKKMDKQARALAIKAAEKMREIEEDKGLGRLELYKEVGLSPDQGRLYFGLLDIYSLLPRAEFDRLLDEDGKLPDDETHLLSLEQVDRLVPTLKRLKDPTGTEAVRLILRVARGSITGMKIEVLVPKPETEEEEKLFKRLGLTEADILAARAVVPTPPEPKCDKVEDRLILWPSGGSLASLVAALSSPGVFAQVDEAGRDGVIVEVRWPHA